MIVAIYSKGNGQKGMLVGLSRRNTELLIEGKPIKINFADKFGGKLEETVDEISIVGGETENAIANELEEAGIYIPGRQ